MEVRCGKCNKLFRVSDDKITGRGIKFSCTRCGEYVKITREEFENYSLAQSAVSALDLFQTPARTTVEPSTETVPVAAAGEEAGFAEAAREEPKTTEPSFPAVPDFLQERDEQPSPTPDPFEESPPMMEEKPLDEPPTPSPLPEEKEPEVPIEPEPRHEPAREPEPESPVELKPELTADEGPDVLSVPNPVPEQVPEQRPAVKPEAYAPKMETGPVVMTRPAAAAISAAARVSGPEKAAPKKEPFHPAGAVAPKPAKETAPSETVRSGRTVPLILGAALILGLAGLGTYLYVKPSPPAVKEPGPVMVSTEGLQIVNPTGSLDVNGDLLVSGVLENLTDKERADWYIVVDVFDAQGKAVNTIRLLSGRQIYTKRDYEILAKRGANVPELKEKARQPHGVVLPPKGRTSFEIRYLQPPEGVASFNAALQPFDPARLLREIEAEAR